MKKKQNNEQENYLERIPKRPEGLGFSISEDGLVVLEIENKGVFNRIAQKVFRKPKVSYIHLDEMGSFNFQTMDGRMNLMEIGKLVEEKFGKEANPLYERLAQYFQILDSYGFVAWVNETQK